MFAAATGRPGEEAMRRREFLANSLVPVAGLGALEPQRSPAADAYPVRCSTSTMRVEFDHALLSPALPSKSTSRLLRCGCRPSGRSRHFTQGKTSQGARSTHRNPNASRNFR